MNIQYIQWYSMNSMNIQWIFNIFNEFSIYSMHIQYIQWIFNEFNEYSMNIQSMFNVFSEYSMNIQYIQWLFNEYARYSINIQYIQCIFNIFNSTHAHIFRLVAWRIGDWRAQFPLRGWMLARSAFFSIDCGGGLLVAGRIVDMYIYIYGSLGCAGACDLSVARTWDSLGCERAWTTGMESPLRGDWK